MIESGIAFPVAVLTSGYEGYIPGQLHLDVGAVEVPVVKVAVTVVEAGTEEHERVLVEVLRDHETHAGESKFVVSAVMGERVVVAVVIAREAGVEPELSVHFPSAETVFEHRDSLIEAVDLHAEGVEFILEFHDELLEELEILLGSLFSVNGHERARHDGRHLVTGRGLRTLECDFTCFSICCSRIDYLWRLFVDTKSRCECKK